MSNDNDSAAREAATHCSECDPAFSCFDGSALCRKRGQNDSPATAAAREAIATVVRHHLALTDAIGDDDESCGLRIKLLNDLVAALAPLLARQTAEAEALRKELAAYKDEKFAINAALNKTDSKGCSEVEQIESLAATIAAQARELDEAKAANDRLFRIVSEMRRVADGYMADRDALRAELADAKRDGERLDWLEANTVAGGIFKGTGSNKKHSAEIWFPESVRITEDGLPDGIRAAIDAARDSEKART